MKLIYILLMAPQGQGGQENGWYSFLPAILILSVIGIAMYISNQKKNNAMRPSSVTENKNQVNQTFNPLSFEERYERFASTISNITMRGYQVADRNDKTLVAVLFKPKEKVNHLLHFFISVISCGFWILVWIVITLNASKEVRVKISIDSAGNYIEEIITV